MLLQVTASKGEVTQRAFLAVLSLLTQDLIPSPCIILAALLIHLVAFLSVSHPPLLVDLVAVSLVPSFVVHGVSLILSQHFLASSHESISTSSSVPTGLKPIETDVKYVAHDRQVNFIQNHFNHIKWFTEMPNNEWRFELYKQIDTHYNRQHVACEILSVSKNIMNEVMCLAEDIDAMIHYTDTDSMHIQYDAVERLGAAFLGKYGRELIGKKLGQFHTDFDFDSSYHTVDGELVRVGDAVRSKGEIHACESIFLGKKSYIDRLRDDEGNEAFHIRLKGIPSKCIQAKTAEAYGGDPMKLYTDLFEGKEVEFDLESGGNCVFKTNKDHSICTGSMKRKVCFCSGDPSTDEEVEID